MTVKQSKIVAATLFLIAVVFISFFSVEAVKYIKSDKNEAAFKMDLGDSVKIEAGTNDRSENIKKAVFYYLLPGIILIGASGFFVAGAHKS